MKNLETVEYYEEMNTVVEAMLKGETNATALARELKMPRAKVMDYMDAWRDIARNDIDIKNRAREALTNMDKHYDMIIKRMWEVVNTENIDLKTKANTLKQIADVESKRQDTLHKVGIYDDNNLANEMVRTQMQADAIKELLRTVATKYPETKADILEGLNEIFNEHVTVDNQVRGEILA
jgi:lipocalin